MLATLKSYLYTFYYNVMTYVPKNNDFIFTKIYHNGTLILLKENIKDIHRPTLVIIPGTTGDTQNTFISTIVDKFMDNGFNVVFILQQGQKINKVDPIPVESPQLICLSYVGDVDYAMKYIKSRVNNKIFMLGTSFGTVHMMKYLYHDEDIVAGISVCSPWNLRKTLKFWENSMFVKMTYDKMFTKYFKSVIEKNKDLFLKSSKENPKIDINRILQAQNISEIINYQAQYYNYDSLEDYLYECKAKVKKIKRPILFIHSKDDPICPIENMPTHKIKEPHQIYTPESGGHVGWYDNIDEICFEWCRNKI
jgi:predicted alpha/beta-fold hydrolase